MLPACFALPQKYLVELTSPAALKLAKLKHCTYCVLFVGGSKPLSPSYVKNISRISRRNAFVFIFDWNTFEVLNDSLAKVV
jgi:hypothetical protein